MNASNTLVEPKPRLQGATRARDLLTGLHRLPIIPILILLIVLVIPALFASFIAPYDPLIGDLRTRLAPPVFFGGTWDHVLGTDRLGRDILSRIIHGAGYSLAVAMLGITVGATIGTTLGLIAGYFGGWVDATIMRCADVFFAFPSILLGLALAAISGPSFGVVTIVVSAALWASFARQVRGEVLSLRQRDFIARARVSGCGHLRIMFRHLLPNVVNTLIVMATLQVGVVIMLEATLSFLGIGIPRPLPAWGLLVADGRTLIVSAWWVSFFPGIAIVLTVVSVNLFGDWLRDRLDPKMKDN